MGAPDTRRVELLRGLGFTDLEAETYAALVNRAPATAYAIGRIIGKPTANVYKAVESLARKGAVLIEEGTGRQCRAIAPDLLFGRLEQTMLRDFRKARAVFAEPDPSSVDERVYRLETSGQVIQRCVEMLDRAESIAAVDAFPAALAAIAAAVERTAARGIQVFVEAYAPCSIPGADIVVVEQGPVTLRRWRSEQLNVVIDGREHIAALLSTDLTRVYQAVWSSSLYLSCLMHAGRVAEHTLVKLMTAKRPGKAAGSVRQVLANHPFFANTDVPGQTELVERFTGQTVSTKAGRSRSKRRGSR
jgi:HTH-type transcriptional regulator, sugar sensing transcriptional regulator